MRSRSADRGLGNMRGGGVGLHPLPARVQLPLPRLSRRWSMHIRSADRGSGNRTWGGWSPPLPTLTQQGWNCRHRGLAEEVACTAGVLTGDWATGHAGGGLLGKQELGHVQPECRQEAKKHGLCYMTPEGGCNISWPGLINPLQGVQVHRPGCLCCGWGMRSRSAHRRLGH